MELLTYLNNFATQAGGLVALSVFAIAIWALLNKKNSANNAEGSVYDLMAKEINRLSKALEHSDEQLKELRSHCYQDRKRADKEICELREMIRELQNKVIGD